MALDVQYRRPDGTFVALVNGMPYHVVPEDPLFAAAQAAGASAPFEPAPVPIGPTQIRSISFSQLLIGLVSEGWITQSEGENWLVGTLPAPVLALIATLPAGQQFAARARATRPSVVLRDDALVLALGAAQGKSAGQLDAFFNTYGAV